MSNRTISDTLLGAVMANSIASFLDKTLRSRSELFPKEFKYFNTKSKSQVSLYLGSGGFLRKIPLIKRFTNRLFPTGLPSIWGKTDDKADL